MTIKRVSYEYTKSIQVLQEDHLLQLHLKFCGLSPLIGQC